MADIALYPAVRILFDQHSILCSAAMVIMLLLLLH